MHETALKIDDLPTATRSVVAFCIRGVVGGSNRSCSTTGTSAYLLLAAEKNAHLHIHQCCHSIFSIGPNKAIFDQLRCHRRRQCMAEPRHSCSGQKENALTMSTIYIVAVCQWLKHFNFPPTRRPLQFELDKSCAIQSTQLINMQVVR